MNTRTLDSFYDELLAIRKHAGFREAATTFFTGRVPLYHGTTSGIAERILQQGIRPQGSAGVSSVLGLSGAETGLAFTTRRLRDAENYAAQATGLDRVRRIEEAVGPSLQRVIDKGTSLLPQPFQEAAKIPQVRAMTRMNAARTLSRLPGGKRVVRASVPRSALREMEGPIPELSHGPQAEARATLREAAKQPDVPPLGRAAINGAANLGEVNSALILSGSVPVKGGLPTRYIKGSRDYQRVTPSELKEHVRSVVKDPMGFAKDVGRSLTGMSHSPGELIARSKKPVV